MGIFFTDFSDSTVGLAPAGWSALTGTPGAVVVAESGASGGKIIRFGETGYSHAVLACDSVADVADCEVVYKARVTSFATYCELYGSTRLVGSYTGYSGGLSNSGSWYNAIRKISNGSGALNGPLTPFDGVWFWVRFRSEGSTHSYKRWIDGDEEPAAWTFTRIDTGYVGAGAVGIEVSNPSPTAHLDIDFFGVGFDGDVAPTGLPDPEAEIDATTTAEAEIAGFHPPTATIGTETGDATASVEATYTLVFVADLGLQAAGAASQFEVLHASGILAAVAGNTEGAVATLSLVHVPAIAGAVAALCENAESTITGNLLALVFGDVDATTADAALVLALSITFDVVAGAVTAPQPSIVGLVGMEFPLNGTAFALSPEIDSALTAEYQSYLQGLVLPVPTAYGTATYELTLQGVT